MARLERRKALRAAIEAGDRARARRLCEQDPGLAGAATSHGNSPLAWAVAAGDPGIVEDLLGFGADPTRRNDGGHGLLDVAAWHGHAELGALLEARGLVPDGGHLAAFGWVQRLEAHLAEDPTRLGRERFTRRRQGYLHLAVQGRALASVDHLLRAGACLEDEDRNGHTPLSLCAQEPRGARVELARRLLAAGASPEAPGGHHGGRILHQALRIRDEALVRLLLESGASREPLDWSGKSPLDLASEVSRRMRALLDSGGDAAG